jgi:RNA polymerase sigma-70 factor (ECF subfamily)
MVEGTSPGFIEDAYAQHAATLRRRLVTVVRDAAEAEDLAQEAFLRLVEEVERGRVPDNAGAWLWRVSRNLATSRGRRRMTADRHRHRLLSVAGDASPEAIAVEAEAHRAVVDALSSLDPAGRRATILAAYGMPGREIARSIGRTPGATRTMLCRARARLRAAVATPAAPDLEAR